MRNNRIIDFLYIGFRPYVKKKELAAYDSEYIDNGKNSLSFAKTCLRFIDINKYSKKTKQSFDALLFNYYLIEMDVFGMKQTPTLRKFKLKNSKMKLDISI